MFPIFVFLIQKIGYNILIYFILFHIQQANEIDYYLIM